MTKRLYLLCRNCRDMTLTLLLAHRVISIKSFQRYKDYKLANFGWFPGRYCSKNFASDLRNTGIALQALHDKKVIKSPAGLIQEDQDLQNSVSMRHLHCDYTSTYVSSTAQKKLLFKIYILRYDNQSVMPTARKDMVQQAGQRLRRGLMSLLTIIPASVYTIDITIYIWSTRPHW